MVKKGVARRRGQTDDLCSKKILVVIWPQEQQISIDCKLLEQKSVL